MNNFVPVLPAVNNFCNKWDACEYANVPKETLTDKVFSIFYRGCKQPKSFHTKSVLFISSAKVIPFCEKRMLFNAFYISGSLIPSHVSAAKW